MTSQPIGPRADDLMAKAFEAMAARDVDRLAELWDEHTTDVIVALQLEIVGEHELRGFFDELFTALPDLLFIAEAIHEVDANTAVGQWHLAGTFSGGPFQGVEPTGRRVAVRGVDVMRFENGILRRSDVYYDGLSFARQIGLLPAAGSLADRGMTAAFNARLKARRVFGRPPDD